MRSEIVTKYLHEKDVIVIIGRVWLIIISNF